MVGHSGRFSFRRRTERDRFLLIGLRGPGWEGFQHHGHQNCFDISTKTGQKETTPLPHSRTASMGPRLREDTILEPTLGRPEEVVWVLRFFGPGAGGSGGSGVSFFDWLWSPCVLGRGHCQVPAGRAFGAAGPSRDVVPSLKAGCPNSVER